MDSKVFSLYLDQHHHGTPRGRHLDVNLTPPDHHYVRPAAPKYPKPHHHKKYNRPTYHAPEPTKFYHIDEPEKTYLPPPPTPGRATSGFFIIAVILCALSSKKNMLLRMGGRSVQKSLFICGIKKEKGFRRLWERYHHDLLYVYCVPPGVTWPLC